MTTSLVGPKLKIERANRQIREVTDAITAFAREQRYETFIERNPAKGQDLLKARPQNKLPEEIAVIVGEALHNLRSALDQMVHSVGNRNGVFVLERSGFPIEITEQKFEAKLRKRKIQERLPKLASFLRELQPYERGNPLLWRLHLLNATDKHNVIVPICSALQRAFSMFFVETKEPGRPHTLTVPHEPQSLEDETIVLMRMDPSGMNVRFGTVKLGPIELKSDIQIATDVAFRNVNLKKFEPVIATLQQFSDLTRGIIGAAERRFF